MIPAEAVVVEDSVTVRMSLRGVLVGQGYEVLVAGCLLELAPGFLGKHTSGNAPINVREKWRCPSQYRSGQECVPPMGVDPIFLESKEPPESASRPAFTGAYLSRSRFK